MIGQTKLKAAGEMHTELKVFRKRPWQRCLDKLRDFNVIVVTTIVHCQLPILKLSFKAATESAMNDKHAHLDKYVAHCVLVKTLLNKSR